MRLSYKIISFLLVLAIAISIFPVCAYAEGYTSTPSTFDEYLLKGIGEADKLPFAGNILQYIVGHACKGVCPNSTDGLHHADSNSRVGGFGSVNGVYVRSVVCRYCGQRFDVYPSDVHDAYENKVDEMPVNGIDNDGGYWWYPHVSDIAQSSEVNDQYIYFTDSGAHRAGFTYDGSLLISDPFWVGANFILLDHKSSIGISATFESSKSGPPSGTIFLRSKICIKMPVSGLYTQYSNAEADFHFFCTTQNYHYSFGDPDYVGIQEHYNSGELYSYLANDGSHQVNVSPSAISGDLHLPYFRFVPDMSTIIDLNDYKPDTRPGSGIHIDNVTIIDEQNNYYTDPNSGEQHEINNWTYDYSDRSYHVTTNEGDNITVTYGDENITIQEGDTVYTYNYTIESAPCNHHYEISAEHEPTCTVNGSIVYTCSECGATYTETTPPLGHDWEFVESVPAVTDENENVTEEAYDLYRCRRCGEERRVPVGSSPATDGETETGFFSWLRKWLIAFKEWLNDKLDALRGGGGGNTTVINDLDPNDDPNGGDDNNDPADDRAHSHDDDDGAGWLMWFVRKVTKLAGKAFRGVAGVALEDALDVASDNLDGFKNFYGDKPIDGVDGYAQYDERTVFQ